MLLAWRCYLAFLQGLADASVVPPMARGNCCALVAAS